jgi:MFS family permease
MLFLGFPLGFFVSGNFSGCGPFLTELFPSRVRGSGQGFVYNFGRGLSAFTAPIVGAMSSGMPLGQSIGIVAVIGFSVVILTVSLFPETRGKTLVAYD